jgi:hypothetical protein
MIARDGKSERIARAGTASLLGALLVASYDLARAAVAPSTDFESMGDLPRLLPRTLLLCPALASLAAMALVLGFELVRERFLGVRVATLAAAAVTSSPILVFLVPLFSGAAIAESAWRFPLLGLSLVVSIAALAAWVHALGAIGRRISRAPGRRRTAAALGALVLPWIAIPLLDLATMRVLKGLYAPAHQLASLVAVSLCASGIWAALRPQRLSASPRRAVLIASILAAGGAALALSLGADAPLGRQLLADSAPFAGPFQGPLNRAEDAIRWSFDDAAAPASRRGGASPHSRVRFPGSSPRRSVLLVTVDALRADALSPGAPLAASAPQLIALGTGALRFARAYSPSNTTPLSVPAMVLGAHGALGASPDLGDSIVAPFARAGYETHFFFTSHEFASLERTPLWPLASRGFGFGVYHREYLSAAEILARARGVFRGAGPPRFVWAHLSDLHSPFFLHADAAYPSLAEGYSRELAALDGVLAGFVRRFARDFPDAIWALSSDHGESLGERGVFLHSSNLYDEQTRVPLYLGGCGVGRGLVEQPVSLLPLGATLAVLAGADAGRDVPLLPTKPLPPGARLAPILTAGSDACAWIDFPHKLIADRGKGTLALYDLARDPGETRNLVGDERALAKALMERLLAAGCPYDIRSLAIR